MVRACPLIDSLLVLYGSQGFASDSLVFLEEPGLLSHRGLETLVSSIWRRNIVDGARGILSLMKLYTLNPLSITSANSLVGGIGILLFRETEGVFLCLEFTNLEPNDEGIS